jgi:hypothetical protein
VTQGNFQSQEAETERGSGYWGGGDAEIEQDQEADNDADIDQEADNEAEQENEGLQVNVLCIHCSNSQSNDVDQEADNDAEVTQGNFQRQEGEAA